MSARAFLCIAAAATLTLGAGLQAAAPAEAASGHVIKAGGFYRDDYPRKYFRWRHTNRLKDKFEPTRWHSYPPECHLRHRPYRVRSYDRYHGWHTKTIWRPIHVCR